MFLVVLVAGCTSHRIELVEERFEDGSPKVVRIYDHEGDTLPSGEIFYYPDGQLRMKGNFKDGKRQGKWSYWYPNGNLWSQGEYRNGEEHGLKTVWHENGQKYYEGYYKNGKRTGTWTFWNKDGSLIKEVNYDER